MVRGLKNFSKLDCAGSRMPNLPFNRNVVLALTRAIYTLPQMFLNRPGASAA
jgi:hypothetical protein